MKRLILICTAFFVSVSIVQAARAKSSNPGDIETGFVSIFNGEDLTGWDGDPRLWSVKDGAIRGQTTEENPAQNNTFCIWRGGQGEALHGIKPAVGGLKNFILKIKFRIENGNSGIQYRSKEFDKWRISGYQAEVENNPDKVGSLYHEAGRGWLVNVGDIKVIDEQGNKNVVGKVSDVEALKKAGYYKEKDWNEYTIIARGNHIIHYLNGYQTIELIDNDRVTDPTDKQDQKGAAGEGLLALQIHKGKPMVVEFKDIRVKHLPEDYEKAFRLFNGEDLSGWTFSSDELKETFGVRDGVITDTGQPRGYIRTIENYTNYVLRLQLRHVEKGNSGVLLRMTGEDKIWPKSIEAQGASDNMGDIWNIDNVPMKVDPARTKGRRTVKLHQSNEKPIGEWNEYEIYLNGGDLRIYVNRLLQNYATECQEIPGRICLQAEGSPKEFRNIVLIPIQSSPVEVNELPFETTSETWLLRIIEFNKLPESVRVKDVLLLMVDDNGTTATVLGKAKISEEAVFADLTTAIENRSSTDQSIRLTDIHLHDLGQPETLITPVAFIFRRGMWTRPRDENFQISVPPHDQCLLCLLFSVPREMTHAEVKFPTLERIVLPTTKDVEQRED